MVSLNTHSKLIALMGVLAFIGACSTPPSTQGPSPRATPKRDTEPPNSAPMATQTPQKASPAPLPPDIAEKSLDTILSEYTQKWRQDYPLRMKLAGKCPASKGYSYGMRMLQPSSFQGEFADSVKRKYGNTSDFVVIAVGPGSAAEKLKIIVGDRLIRVGGVKSTQPNAGKTLGEESRKWSQPYDVIVIRNGREVALSLQPDLLCEIPL